MAYWSAVGYRPSLVESYLLGGEMTNVQLGLKSEPDSKPDVYLGWEFRDLETVWSAIGREAEPPPSLQAMDTSVTSAPSIVPEPLLTTQLCPTGGLSTVTL